MKRRTVQINLALLGLAALWVTLLAGNRGRFEAERRPDPPAPGRRAPPPPDRPPRPRPPMPPPLPATTSSTSTATTTSPEEVTEDAEESLGPAPVPDGDHGDRRPGRGPHGFAGLPKLRRPLPPPHRWGRPWTATPCCWVEGNRVVMKAGATEGEGEHRRPPRRVRQAGEVRQAGSQAPRGPAHLHRGGVAEPPAGRPAAGPLHPFHPSRQSAGGHRPGRKAAGHHFHALRRHPALGRG